MKGRTNILVVLMLFVSQCFNASAQSEADEPLKFLFIGNSYTYMNDMPSMFEKIAKKSGKNVLVEKNTQGGASFRIHTGREDMFQAIRKRQWDYVILQGFSREMSFRPDYIDTASVPFIQQILDSIYANNACTSVRFYMTWGYDEGFKEREEVDTYDKMADSIRKGYIYAGDKFNLPVVPVGMVWKQARNKKGIDLYYKDRAHPSETGSYLIASTFFSAFFDQPIEENYFSKVDDDLAATINKLSYEYVHKRRKEYHLDDYIFDMELDQNWTKSMELDYKADFPGATLNWYVGDSLISSKPKGSYKLEKGTEQVVKLEVERDCGVRVYAQVISTQPIDRARRCRRKDKEE